MKQFSSVWQSKYAPLSHLGPAESKVCHWVQTRHSEGNVLCILKRRKSMGQFSLFRKPIQVLSTWTYWTIGCGHNWQRALSRKLGSFNKMEHHLTITGKCHSSLMNN
ncbi:hypothetical protein Cfor_10550 [Coptotermes formosanus]|uniref:Uncharacterized protein n=1 Tax=Coptotermes formosanus TaxID=36987 RepID=A0A6L2PWU9_COPFO|nr:hypothetical protein Cfor_10550 [Coptotermes formosanus]